MEKKGLKKAVFGVWDASGLNNGCRAGRLEGKLDIMAKKGLKID